MMRLPWNSVMNEKTKFSDVILWCFPIADCYMLVYYRHVKRNSNSTALAFIWLVECTKLVLFLFKHDSDQLHSNCELGWVYECVATMGMILNSAHDDYNCYLLFD